MSEEWPETKRVESIGKFAEWLLYSTIPDKDKMSAYRGQSDSAWCLESSLDRILPKGLDCNDWLDEEKRIQFVFRCQAPRFLGCLEQKYVATTRLGCMMVMQHFGVTTRLLDWTWSPAIAAYFACIGGRDCDSTVWRFNATAVEHYVDSRWEKVWGFTRWNDNPRSQIKLEPRMFDPSVNEIVTLARHEIPFPRAQAQRGLFTLGMPLGVEQQAVLRHEAGGDCDRITIAASVKHDILDYLKVLGIDAISLQYAGADRIGLRVAWDLEQERNQRCHNALADADR